MRDYDKIKACYTQYGFIEEEHSDNYAVFSLINTIFPGVDIVIDNEEDYENLQSEYSKAGYSTNKVVFTSYEDIVENLYERFLRPSIAKSKLLEQYKLYTDKIIRPYCTKSYTPKYLYLEVDYSYEHNFRKGFPTKTLVPAILELIGQHGPKLIIIEAAAGYGKTSTSYELLKNLCESVSNKRPFLMELERDRQATTFRYLLLSQIERTFDLQLKNKIVLDHIKAGRIPLIIDGFDELLSLDLDKGRDIMSFNKLQTMLSTIAELLEGNSKVILTTRKTATFSSEEFTEWYNYQSGNQNRKFDIERFQLYAPEPATWIEQDKLKLLPDTLRNLPNPVLLSFLKYSPESELRNINSTQTLVEKYLLTMFRREKERQTLPFNNKQQEEVLKNLAAYFCVFDITADTRDSVKDILKESNFQLISEYAEDINDIKALVNKLVNHALLDRHNSGLVGFINDFILGTLLWKSFLSGSSIFEDLDELSISYGKRIIEAACLLDSGSRTELATSLRKNTKLSADINFLIDCQLLKSITQAYSDMYLTEMAFDNIFFGGDGNLERVTFTNCTFKSCYLDMSSFTECCFINCEFIDTEFEAETDNRGTFFECRGIIFANEESPEKESKKADQPESADSLVRDILSMFFKVDTANSKINHISSIIRELQKKYTRRYIMKTLSRLKSKGYLYIDGDIAWILQPGSDYLKTM